MKKIFLNVVITIVSVVFISSCNNTFQNKIYENDYQTYVNIFDTVSYLSYRNELENNIEHTFYEKDLKFTNIHLKYENDSLTLWYNIYDVHKYYNVFYKDYDYIEKINNLPSFHFTIRVYYDNNQHIILITTDNIEKLMNVKYNIENMAYYIKLNQTLEEFDKTFNKENN